MLFIIELCNVAKMFNGGFLAVRLDGVRLLKENVLNGET
jgi:hypothetical protein